MTAMSGTTGAMNKDTPDLQSLADIPFLVFLGVRAEEVESGRSILVLELQPHHENSLEMAHGGVVMTLLDVAMARAGRSLAKVDEGEATTLITIEMKTTFIAPAQGSVRAEGRVLQRTSTMAFCEADLYAEDGRLSARASGTFKYVKKRSQTA